MDVSRRKEGEVHTQGALFVPNSVADCGQRHDFQPVLTLTVDQVFWLLPVPVMIDEVTPRCQPNKEDIRCLEAVQDDVGLSFGNSHKSSRSA